MAAELISPDALKIGLVAILGLGYAAYKAGLLDKIQAARGADTPHFRPRPVYLARRVRFEKAVLDICGIDQLQLIRTTARLRRMGFWIVGDFTLPTTGPPLGPRQKLFARAFVHGEEPIYALAVERKGLKAPSPYVDYFTLFTDLTFLTATNSDEDDDPRRPGALRFHRLPGLLPEELYQHHRANLEALRNNWMKAVPASREAFFSHLRQWLVVDSELRRARDQEVRKDQITRTVESLPALDIGPILKRYDDQRTPYEFAHKGVPERVAGPAVGSPTVIKDPERAPIRRRLPPSSPSGPFGPGPAPMPAAGAIPIDPTYGDALSSSPGGFAGMAPEPHAYYQETAQAHPLDMLDRFDTATPLPGNAPYEATQDYGGALAYEQPDQSYYQTGAQGYYPGDAAPAGAYPAAEPSHEIDPAPEYHLFDPEPSDPEPRPEPGFTMGQDHGGSGYFAASPATEAASEPPAPTFVFDAPPDEPAVPSFVFDSPPEEPSPSFGFDPPNVGQDLAPQLPGPLGFAFDEGTPTDPPSEIAVPPFLAEAGEPLPQDIRISLRQIQSWRPPDFSQPAAPDLPDAPERCPSCRARTLSRYSQRCHKCRSPLVEAVRP